MKKNTEYLNFIAYLQIIGIILVVLGHSFHEFPDNGQNGTSLFLYRLCYSFRMPLFLFVSGFLMIYTTEVAHNPKITPGNFILNKIKRLMLPMVVLSAVTFVPRSLMSFAADDNITLSWHSFLMAFIDMKYMPIPFFWFLHVSFLLLVATFVLMYLSNKIGLSPKITILALLVILLVYAVSDVATTTVFSISELKRIGLFFVLGGVYSVFMKGIDRFMGWTNPLILILNFTVWIVSFLFLEGTGYIVICSFFGILTWISVAKIIEKRGWKFLDHLKGANYIIFLLSWFCNVVSQQVLSYYTHFPWWCYTILSLFSGIYVPWAAYRYLEKHQDSNWVKVTAFLLGQSFRKRNVHNKTAGTIS